jgi:thiol-disulfide isomerase/thioredoxin
MNKGVLLIILPLLILAGCRGNQYGQDNPFSAVDVKGLCENPDVVATGNLSGSAHDDLILGKDSVIYVYSLIGDSAHLLYSASFESEVHKICTADADNDGSEDIVLLNGWSRYKDDRVSLHLVSHSKKGWEQSEIFTRQSPRPQPVFLAVTDTDGDDIHEIVFSFFESKYMVNTVILKKTEGGWSDEELFVERMATAHDIGSLDRTGQVHVVGRVYGDSLGETGDAYILKGREKIDLNVFRGVRSAVRIGDGNNDRHNEIFVGDGWHQNYGKMARARLAVISPGDTGYSYSLIEDIRGETDVSQIEVADINGDRLNEVLVSCNNFMRIYKNEDGRWLCFSDTSLTAGPFAVGNIAGDRRKEVIIAGRKYDGGLSIFDFGRLPFKNELGKEVITQTVYPDSLTGKKAPELRIVEWIPESSRVKVPEEGKVFLLDFWATWCGPCKKMFPALRKLQDKYREQGLTIIGLTRPDGRQSVESIIEFINNEQFNYPAAISEEAFNELSYGVGAIPHMVLIDKQGIVRKAFIGTRSESEVEDEIRKLLNE